MPPKSGKPQNPGRPQPDLPDMGDLLKQAQKMQQQLLDAQAAAAEAEVEGQAGGGAVKVRVTGGMEFRSVKIDPSALPAGGADPDDVEMLEDLVLAAIHDAVAKAQSVSQEAMGDLGLGDIGKLLG
jgi:DNA-binding YbaB/EbfC family protein